MKITIFFTIFICEIIAVTTYILVKLTRDIYTYKKVNKSFEELMRASQGGKKDN